MRIREIMTKNVQSIDHAASVAQARDLMRSKAIRHLVVRQDGRPVGVLSDRDVGGPRGVVPTGSVGDAMSRGIVTVAPDSTLRDAANLLRGHVVGCLPVIEDDRLVGIVTISDVLDVLGRGSAPQRGRAKPYVARRQGPLGKPRGERFKARGR